ncbi:hypothetical protein LCGC14_2643660 [marine sediment metagenome]|uniref:Uncharacterized protein n=2 Tax=marine sediment metagenome TaxID=412755 RepID=A0A0F9AJA7_9ZZZZ
MGKKDTQRGGGKNRRVSPAKIARYWSERHPVNMCRRAIRVFRRVEYMGRRKARRMDELSQQYWRKVADAKAKTEAQKCASAHGPSVEAGLARWLRGEPAFKREKIMKGSSILYIERA